MERWRPHSIRYLLGLLFPAVGLVLALLPTHSAEPPVSPEPFFAIEAGMHTAQITSIAVDAAGRHAVTASVDKTARVWDVASSKQLSVMRVPVGQGNEGKLYAAAMSSDARVVALGGWTGPQGGTNSIYLFDRASGRMTRRINGPPNITYYLAFSFDGRLLAASLEKGICIFRVSDGTEVWRDINYKDRSYSVEFDRKGRLLATSYDGELRLYGPAPEFKLLAKRPAPGGSQPFFARFSPDASLIAVGFADSTKVNILSGNDLRFLYEPDTSQVNNGNLFSVAWSTDGSRLYAAGRFEQYGLSPIVVWPKAGRGTPQFRPASTDTIVDLRPLANGGLVFGSTHPAWGVLSAEGQILSLQDSPIADFRASLDSLRLSANGQQVRFSYEQGGKSPAVFDWPSRNLGGDRTGLASPRTAAPGLNIANWKDSLNPTLNGQRLVLNYYELSRSLAVSRDGTRFALGTDWSLRLYDRSGRLLWQVPSPGVVWSVNVSDDGRWVVATYGDGTIRWHRLSDGREVLALFPHRDRKRWIAWTPEGYFDSSPGAEGLIGYRLNRGTDRAGEFIAATRLLERFYRPSVIARRLEAEGDALVDQVVRDGGDVRKFLARSAPVPSVQVLSAAETHSEGEYDLKIAIKDQGGGVGRLIIQINGQEVEDRTEVPTVATDMTVSRKFVLTPGRHVITVAATNGEGVASKPQVITVNVRRPTERPALHMLAVGVSRYQDQALNLRFAAKDAATIQAHFERQGTSFYRTVYVRGLQDEQATRANIESAMHEIAVRAQPSDVFVLYLAGYGVSIEGNYHFLTYETQYKSPESLRTHSLDQNTLVALLNRIPAAKILLLLDTSHSFASVESRGGRLSQQQAIDRFSQLIGRVIIAASADNQMSLEGADGQHGVFTYTVLEALRGAADFNRNGMVEVDELAAYVVKKMPLITRQKWGYEQFPMYTIQGASFPILPTPKQ
jgi:WD40 repeat protein